MTKKELAAKISGKLDVPIGKVTQVLDTAIMYVTNELMKGNSVQFLGFGTFEPRVHSERNGRNPRTGETITLAPRKYVYFKQGKSLKAVLNG